MSKTISKVEFQQRTISQADKLITNACENRKMLLEYEKEFLPFTLKTALRKSTLERDTVEQYLQQVLSSNSEDDKEQLHNVLAFQESHNNFMHSSERLINISNALNKSLTVDPDPAQ
eukprot:gene2452-2608_t